MRSAENTVGHAAEFPSRGACAVPHRAGTLAGNVTEYATEGSQARPARLEGDIGDRQIGVTKQRGGTLDSFSSTDRTSPVMVESPDLIVAVLPLN